MSWFSERYNSQTFWSVIFAYVIIMIVMLILTFALSLIGVGVGVFVGDEKKSKFCAGLGPTPPWVMTAGYPLQQNENPLLMNYDGNKAYTSEYWKSCQAGLGTPPGPGPMGPPESFTASAKMMDAGECQRFPRSDYRQPSTASLFSESNLTDILISQ